MNDKMPRNRQTWMDLLNICATLSVVALHCNGCFWQFSNTPEWRSSIVIECLCYWAVPVFFMMTGANLLNYNARYDTKRYFVQRIRRTVIPYLLFSTFAILVVYRSGIKALSFRDILNIYLTGDVLIYWFFIPLFATYLAIPVLASVGEGNRKKVYSYIVIASFLFNSFFPFVCQFINLEWNLSVPVCGGYVIYVLAGYLLTCEIELSAKYRKWLYCFGMLGLFFRAAMIYIMSTRQGEIYTKVNGYLTPVSIVFSVAVFAFFRYEVKIIMEKVPNNWERYFSVVSKTGFGVYLIHAYLTTYFPLQAGFEPTSYVWRFIGPLFVYSICVGCVLIVKKLPILNKLL